MTMETHITTLGATVQAINRRQAAARRRSRKGIDATPFTTAVLNRERLDIVTYIRDADPHTEANLFWYPPLAQSHSAPQKHAGPSQYSHRATQPSTQPNQPRSNRQLADLSVQKILEAQEAELLLAPRVPEPKQIQPPTPLRQTGSSRSRPGELATAGGEGPATDIRTLLLAAQKLNDTYRSAPKARKHIKGLLKRHAELARTVRECESQIQANDARIRAVLAGRNAPAAGQERAQTAKASSVTLSLQAELASIKEATRKDELEVLALEELIVELKQEAKTKKASAREAKQQTPPLDSQPRTDPNATPVASRTSEEHALPSHREADLARPASALAAASQAATDGAVKARPSVDAPTPSEVVDERSTAATDLADSTVALRPAPAVSASEIVEEIPVAAETSFESRQPAMEARPEPEAEAEAQPESSEELDRVTELVWRLFGDGLRHVAPEREGGDYAETLRLLRQIMSGGGNRGAGDTSLGSAQTFSTETTATTTTASSGSSTPFNADLAMTAFVIHRMMTTAAPHALNIEELRTQGHEWWSHGGRDEFVRATRTDADDDRPSEVPDDGQNLARKSIYGMVSKQLFTLKRLKGVGTIQFA